jgi:hypothetical protein
MLIEFLINWHNLQEGSWKVKKTFTLEGFRNWISIERTKYNLVFSFISKIRKGSKSKLFLNNNFKGAIGH